MALERCAGAFSALSALSALSAKTRSPSTHDSQRHHPRPCRHDRGPAQRQRPARLQFPAFVHRGERDRPGRGHERAHVQRHREREEIDEEHLPSRVARASRAVRDHEHNERKGERRSVHLRLRRVRPDGRGRAGADRCREGGDSVARGPREQCREQRATGGRRRRGEEVGRQCAGEHPEHVAPHARDKHVEWRPGRMGDAQCLDRGDELARVPQGDGGRHRRDVDHEQQCAGERRRGRLAREHAR